jgi:outer membrane protein, adhesin transport system
MQGGSVFRVVDRLPGPILHEVPMTTCLRPLSYALLLAAACAQAQPTSTAVLPSPLQDVARQALQSNPDVAARLHAYRASEHDTDAARAAYRPRLDLSANAGRERDRFDNRTPATDTLDRTGVSLGLTQVLWDGLAGRHDRQRADHGRMVRYFELVNTSEQVALEALRAYYDVARYRELVRLAEDNYVQHKASFDQIQQRFKAGIGRGVDLEQAGARLALADANLNTEIANLHDVTARYQRIVGILPQRTEAAVTLDGVAVPASSQAVLQTALARSAAVSAAVENLRAARSQASVRQAAYQPRVEARVRTGGGHNYDGLAGQKRDTVGEVVLNWNLYNGGADQARVRQAASLMNQAADERDAACRDVVQTASVAYNDTRKLADQLQYLEANQIAIEKARNAYRRQFDIGQRSLLDLLNAENELYTAQRAYANARHDLDIARLRTQAAMGELLPSLGMSRPLSDTAPDAGWSAGEDGAQRCPVSAPTVETTPRSELDERARKLLGSAPTPATPTTPSSTPPTSSVTPAVPSSEAGAAMSSVLQQLDGWAAAWRAKDLPRYMGFYSPRFEPTTMSYDEWLAQRRVRVTKPGAIGLKLDAIRTRALTPDTIETAFDQTYTSLDYSDKMSKVLTWRQESAQWLIQRETNR